MGVRAAEIFLKPLQLHLELSDLLVMWTPKTEPAFMTALLFPFSPIAPLRRASALVKAADNGLVITSDEQAAFGYCFIKHEQRNWVIWKVELVIGKKPVTVGTAQSLTAGESDKPVGFGHGATLAARGGATIFAANMLRRKGSSSLAASLKITASLSICNEVVNCTDNLEHNDLALQLTPCQKNKQRLLLKQ